MNTSGSPMPGFCKDIDDDIAYVKSQLGDGFIGTKTIKHLDGRTSTVTTDKVHPLSTSGITRIVSMVDNEGNGIHII